MLSSVLFIIVGLGALVYGGEVVIKSASQIARSFGLSPLIIGLTVVAFGTSAPELGVSLVATIKGNADIAVTNVIGSNIFNIAFILGFCALFSPLAVSQQLVKLDIPTAVISTLILYFFSINGVISQLEGFLLLFVLSLYFVILIKNSKKDNEKDLNERPIKEAHIFKKKTLSFIWFVLGIGILVAGSHLLVKGASSLAIRAGVSEAIVGLTLVAAGTSFPELISSLMATRRGHTDIAIGNVIGSNIFNILFILGSSALSSTSGLNVSQTILKSDFSVLLGITFLSLPLLLVGRKLTRLRGVFLLLCYIAYTAFLIYRI